MQHTTLLLLTAPIALAAPYDPRPTPSTTPCPSDGHLTPSKTWKHSYTPTYTPGHTLSHHTPVYFTPGHYTPCHQTPAYQSPSFHTPGPGHHSKNYSDEPNHHTPISFAHYSRYSPTLGNYPSYTSSHGPCHTPSFHTPSFHTSKCTSSDKHHTTSPSGPMSSGSFGWGWE